MAPKTPEELAEQVKAQNEAPAIKGRERTAEGFSVETPMPGAFFGNLKKLSKPDAVRD